MIQKAHLLTGRPVALLLDDLCIPRASYYRWKEDQGRAEPVKRDRSGGTGIVPPTPEEVEKVKSFALSHAAIGYKRLSWTMIDRDVAYLRPYQVYTILDQAELLARRVSPNPAALRRPADPERPDQVWHVDLMYLYIEPRWFYLVDILDGYSRYLVHWRLNPTMHADSVMLTVQEALDKLELEQRTSDRQAYPGEPAIVHDNGSQFTGGQWRNFLAGAGRRDIRTRVAHPQSNGRLERLHRTHREEGLVVEPSNYEHGLSLMEQWERFYNHERPHSALDYLRPVDYYRGDPQARLDAREDKLSMALAKRQAYWQSV